MEKPEVRIVTLEPLRVASFHAFGPGPELIALQKLIDWANPRGLLDGKHRVFGFNNPNPSPGSPNYGYEFWLETGPDMEADKDTKIKELTGGLYAVMRVNGVENIAPSWKKLAAWRAQSQYQAANQQWLEEMVGEVNPAAENMTLDLYIPIRE